MTESTSVIGSFRFLALNSCRSLPSLDISAKVQTETATLARAPRFGRVMNETGLRRSIRHRG